jgi:hypothetical protein
MGLEHYMCELCPCLFKFILKCKCCSGAWSSKAGTMDDIYRAMVQCAELGASEPATQMMGGVAVLDMKGTSLRHVSNLTPSYAKKTIDLLQVNCPVILFLWS